MCIYNIYIYIMWYHIYLYICTHTHIHFFKYSIVFVNENHHFLLRCLEGLVSRKVADVALSALRLVSWLLEGHPNRTNFVHNQ